MSKGFGACVASKPLTVAESNIHVFRVACFGNWFQTPFKEMGTAERLAEVGFVCDRSKVNHGKLSDILLLVLCVALLGAFLTGASFFQFSEFEEHGLLAKRAGILAAVFWLYASVVGGFMVGVGVTRRAFGISPVHEFLTAYHSLVDAVFEIYRWIREELSSRQLFFGVVCITVLGGVFRCCYLPQPITYDEAFTYNEFINAPIEYLFFYPVPNNHVLNTLLTKISVSIMGGSEFALRVPSVIFGVLCLPASVFLARGLGMPRDTAIATGALLSAFPHVVLYDTICRGYSIVTFASILCVGLVHRLVVKPTIGTALLLSASIAMGLMAIPSFLFLVAGLVAWFVALICFSPGRFDRRLISVVAATGIQTTLLTGIAYTPVVIVTDGVKSIVNNPFVQSLDLRLFFERLPDHLSFAFDQAVRGIPGGRFSVTFFAAIGLIYLVRQKSYPAGSLVLSLILGASLLLVTKHAIPFPRTWLYLSPFVLLLVAHGLTQFGSLGGIPEAKRIVITLVSCFILVLAMWFADPVGEYRGVGRCEHAEDAAGFIASSFPNEQVQVSTRVPVDEPLQYYLEQMDSKATVNSQESSATLELFLVKPSRFEGSDLTNKKLKRIRQWDDLELLQSVEE